MQSLVVVIGRELLRIITREGWAYWRKQRQERKYEADMAAFRAGEDALTHRHPNNRSLNPHNLSAASASTA